MVLTQLLGRQRRAKIPAPLADDRQNRAPQRLGFAPIAATAASFRDQAGRTSDPIGLQQPKHLTPLEPEQLPAGVSRPDPNAAAPRAAAARHRSSAEPSPQTPPGNPPGSVTSTLQRGVISTSGESDNTHYVKFSKVLAKSSC